MNLQSVSKAIAGALVAALVAYLAKNNIVLENQYTEAVTLLIAGAIGYIGVYLAPKNKPASKKK